MAAHTMVADRGWLKDARFDCVFIAGLPLLALAAAGAALLAPALLPAIIVLNLWLLGYHHVGATFTRIALTPADRRAHVQELLVLPILVFAFVVALALGAGLWAIATVYLYWQWFHYTRQSWGIARAYARKCPGGVSENPWVAQCAFYLPPLWGILSRSAEGHEVFLGLPVKLLPVPQLLADATGLAAAVALTAWAADRIRALSRGERAPLYLAYMATHWLVFVMGYVLVPDLTIGWLVLNVWHNAQYLLFVWWANRRRADAGQLPAGTALHWLSGRGRAVPYFLATFAATAAVYGLLALGVEAATSLGAGAALVLIYQTINFHHYIVDGVIWRTRAPAPAAQALPA